MKPAHKIITPTALVRQHNRNIKSTMTDRRVHPARIILYTVIQSIFMGTGGVLILQDWEDPVSAQEKGIDRRFYLWLLFITDEVGSCSFFSFCQMRDTLFPSPKSKFPPMYIRNLAIQTLNNRENYEPKKSKGGNAVEAEI